MSISEELRRRVYERLRECEDVARGHGWKVPSYGIAFDVRGAKAGEAKARRNRATGEVVSAVLRFNPVLYQENVEDFLTRTVEHELAHLVCYANFPLERGHGVYFQRVMLAFGGPTERCHSYDTSSVAINRRPYVSRCACPERVFRVGATRFKKQQRGAIYRCPHCKTNLKFAKEV